MIKKAPIEFIDVGSICGCPNMFSGLALRSGNYDGEIQDITILVLRAREVAEPLTLEEQFALRS